MNFNQRGRLLSTKEKKANKTGTSARMGDMVKHRILLINAKLMGTYLPSVLLKHKSKNQKNWATDWEKQKGLCC